MTPSITDAEQKEAVSLLRKINRKMNVLFPSCKPFPLTLKTTNQELYMDIHTLYALLKNLEREPPYTFQRVFEYMYNRIALKLEDMFSSTDTDSSDDDLNGRTMAVRENPFKKPESPKQKSRRSRNIDKVARANAQLRRRKSR